MPTTSPKTAASGFPVMLHRAILGSLERFIGILIEQYAGALPAWLAPVQAVVLNITDHQAAMSNRSKTPYATRFPCPADLRNEKIGFKIREHTLQRIPYLLVVGDREMETETSPCAPALARTWAA
jgi:threonyl-tRNA synthetase